MRRSHGQRQGTRAILRKRRRDQGRLPIRRIMHPYKEGDRVAIVLDGAQQKGMPHRRFHGLTGIILEKRGRALAIEVPIGKSSKIVISRPEHLRPQN